MRRYDSVKDLKTFEFRDATNRSGLAYPRLVYEGGSQIWLKVLVDGVDREIEVPPEIAWDWLIRLPGWLKRIASM